MKHALKVVGRFAFCGWALFTGTIVACILFESLFIGYGSIPGDIIYALAVVFFGGLGGAAGGAVLAVVALVLERLIKRPAANPAAAVDELASDPLVWPPAPKPPQ